MGIWGSGLVFREVVKNCGGGEGGGGSVEAEFQSDNLHVDIVPFCLIGAQVAASQA